MVRLGHDDVQVDDRLGGQAGHARAAHVLDAVTDGLMAVNPKSSDLLYFYHLFFQ